MTTPFRGRLRADGLALDVAVLGEVRARRRVLDLWRPGTTVNRTPDGTWIVALPEPVDLRIEHAPGLALVAVDGVLAGSGVDTAGATPGSVLLPVAGSTVRHAPETLTPVDPTGWIDLAGVTLDLLAPLDPPATTPAPAAVPSSGTVDLRHLAGVGEPSAATRRLLRDAAATGAAAPRRPGLARLFGDRFRSGAPGPRPGTRDGRPRRPGRGLLAGWVLRSPAGALVTQRHARYLRQLTAEFRQGRWEDALREALPLGGGVAGALRLRLPGRWAGALAPTARRPGGGASISVDPDVLTHLRELYTRAADQLEQAGRVEEAAFVHADLLDDAERAVHLLERHGRRRMAAELAEGRQLDAGLVVRLWWRAGERPYAVRLARLRGAFATAVDRLAPVDAEAARELRRAWVAACQEAGDHLGAVDAAWPEEPLRPLVLESIHGGIALGGPTSSALFARLVAHWPSESRCAEATALLDGRDAATRPARAHFAAALAELPVRDPAADRALCTAAVRSLLADPDGPAVAGLASTDRVRRALRERADPLLVADLPPARPSGPPPPGTCRVEAPPGPGQLPLLDAVTLDDAVLVAHGGAGTRLLTLDGRVGRRWDVPADQLVVADHGGTALLVTGHGPARELYRLDLASGTTRWCATLVTRRVLASYDGGILAHLDGDGIAFLDVLADPPRVVWRELDRHVDIHAVARDASSLAALVERPRGPAGERFGLQVWRWDLPGLVLRSRSPVDLRDRVVRGVVVTAAGRLIGLSPRPDGEVVWHLPEAGSDPVVVGPPVPAGAAVLVDGGAVAVVEGAADRNIVRVLDGGGMTEVFSVGFPDAVGTVRLRKHGRTATVSDERGRVTAVHLPDRRLRTALRTRV